MLKKIIYLFIFVLLSQLALAAAIHGTIYNFYLEKQTNVVVSIDSTPKQTFVSADGLYSFNLPAGEYKITSQQMEGGVLKAEAEESISVKQDGDYIVDLILFPALDDEPIEDIDTGIETGISIANIIISVIVVVGFGFIIYLVFKYRKQLVKVTKEVEHAAKEIEKTKVPDEAKGVVDFIKREGRRTTQREIRKNFPSSEAKISLILTDLEHKGIIEKIQKGRGNIIILK